MADHTTEDDRLWAHIFGEMSPDERGELERLMQADPDLRDRGDRLQKMERYLRVLMPYVDPTDEAIEERIIEQWERTHGATDSLPEPGPATAVAKEGPERITISWPWPLAWSAMALAAGLLLMVGVYALRAPSSIDWLSPELVPYAQRGEAAALYSQRQLNQDAEFGEAVALGEAAALYSKRQLRKFSSRLRTAMQERYDELIASGQVDTPSEGARRRSVQARFHEVRPGLLQTEVEVLAEDGVSVVRTWRQTFETSDEYLAGVAEWGAEIAGDLAAGAAP